MKYKVGDKVRIVSKWNSKCRQNGSGGMDKWLGKVMTIRKVNVFAYKMVEDRCEFDGDGWYWNDHCIAGLAKADKHSHPKIVITKDGAETIARRYEAGKCVKTATAKCSPDDTYDFAVGAELAFNRLMGNAEDVPVRKFNVGDRVKHGRFGKGTVICISYDGIFGVEFDKGRGHNCGGITLVAGKKGTKATSHWCSERDLELIGNPKKAKAKAKKKAFQPHLWLKYPSGTEEFAGVIGEPTNYKDAIGRPLSVGDTVEHFNGLNMPFGETVIVKTEKDGAFVMGIQCRCDEDAGTIEGWKVIKKRSYDEISDGERVFDDSIIYRKTER